MPSVMAPAFAVGVVCGFIFCGAFAVKENAPTTLAVLRGGWRVVFPIFIKA